MRLWQVGRQSRGATLLPKLRLITLYRDIAEGGIDARIVLKINHRLLF
jgi:hypothetical protein